MIRDLITGLNQHGYGSNAWTLRHLPIISSNVLAISDGVAATPIPAARNAAIFAVAVPFPPLTIAPACPILRPGGAVAPAITPATGFLQLLPVRPPLQDGG